MSRLVDAFRSRGQSETMSKQADRIKEMLKDVLAPLFDEDGAELYFVSAGKKEVRLHLAGAYSGSPACDLLTERIVAPAVKAVLPKAKLVMSNGWTVPKGAQLMGKPVER